jgi:hypothetical protein
MSNSYGSLVAVLKSHRAVASDDISGMVLKPTCTRYYFSESTCNAANTYDIDMSLMFTLPQKQIKRVCEYLNACVSGLLSGYDRTHARILIATRLGGEYDLTTDAIHCLAAGMRSGLVNTRGITLGQINASKVSAQGMGTVTSKTSNSLGANGFMKHAGMVWSDGTRNNAVSVNTAHAALVRFYAIVDGSTDAQVAALADSK